MSCRALSAEFKQYRICSLLIWNKVINMHSRFDRSVIFFIQIKIEVLDEAWLIVLAISASVTAESDI